MADLDLRGVSKGGVLTSDISEMLIASASFRITMPSKGPPSKTREYIDISLSPNDPPTRVVWVPFRSEEPSMRSSGKLTWEVYRIHDEKTGQVVTMYLASGRGDWRKVGSLEIHRAESKEAEMTIPLGTLAICETTRRKRVGKSTMGSMFNFAW